MFIDIEIAKELHLEVYTEAFKVLCEEVDGGLLRRNWYDTASNPDSGWNNDFQGFDKESYYDFGKDIIWILAMT